MTLAEDTKDTSDYAQARVWLAYAARAAGNGAKKLRQEGRVISWNKVGGDIVTNGDLYASLEIANLLPLFPGIRWESEEGPYAHHMPHSTSDLSLVVDPIDGTKQFASGNNQYSVSIALVKHGIPRVGVIYDPENDLLFEAVEGRGAYCNGNRITVSKTRELHRATRAMTPGLEERAGYDSYCGQMRQRRTHVIGGTALTLASIAAGFTDFYVSPDHGIFGFAAGDLLVREAKGKCTDAYGNSLHYSSKKERLGAVIVSNGKLHNELIKKANH